MKWRPILFSASMVRAVLAGRKSQTRRTAKLAADIDASTVMDLQWSSPHGGAGDRLWVRESWSHDAPDIETCRVAHEDAMHGIGYGPYYRATEIAPDTLRWIPGIFMPRWASRISLEITDVRLQRLQEISGDDARAEGISVARCGCEVCFKSSTMCPADESSHIAEFADLWNSINGKRCPWGSNPWVWAISFRRLP